MKLAIRGGNPICSDAFPAWPVWDEAEEQALQRVLESAKWGSLHGNEVHTFENEFAEYQDARFGIATNSGTAALEIALRAAGIQAGDEVIVPGYTFVATATAVLANAAIPVIADIDLRSYNIDPGAIEEVLTENTKAVVPVHFAGRPADMDRVQQIAEKHRLKIIEDAAQGWGAKWRGRGVGAIGDAGCFSFQSSKNINAGEGGIILTDSEEIAQMARSYGNCGRVEGGVWYAHYHLGGNNRLTEFQGAILRAQLARFPQQLRLRQESIAYLARRMRGMPGVEPLESDDRITGHGGHIYIFRYSSAKFDSLPKSNFVEALQAEGIPCSGGYSIPLYEQPLLRNRSFGPFSRILEGRADYSDVKLQNCHRACYEEAIWLPQRVLLAGPEKMRAILDAIEKIYENRHELI